MDIIYKNKEKIEFKDVLVSIIFSHQDALYIKTKTVNSLMNGEFYNAVNLDSGEFKYFCDNDEVVVEQAKLIIY